MLYFRADKGTPPLVLEVLRLKGWAEVAEDDFFHLTWKCQRFKRSEVEQCKFNQRLNHFPKTEEISRKVLTYSVCWYAN